MLFLRRYPTCFYLLLIMNQGLNGTWSSLIQLDQLASQPKGSPCLCLLCTSIACTCHNPQLGTELRSLGLFLREGPCLSSLACRTVVSLTGLWCTCHRGCQRLLSSYFALGKVGWGCSWIQSEIWHTQLHIGKRNNTLWREDGPLKVPSGRSSMNKAESGGH